jgi:RNA polymerase sigma-70 factor (ECF subfamily)
MTDAGNRRAIEAVFRIEHARLIAVLTRATKDVGIAEELAQDAFATALESWPANGIPEKPGAWLMTHGKRRAIDRLRRRPMVDRAHAEIGRDQDETRDAELDLRDEALDDEIGDDLLRLVFISCHPLLGPEAQVALTLRLMGGLTTGEIARAFLMPEPTIAQRIVRAKKTLSDAQVPFEVPRGADLEARLAAVLATIYLIFNEGYAATAGEDWMRPQLCEEAMRLGRVLTGLAKNEAEVHGLLALMELQASRFPARTNASGEPVLLMDQDRSKWDRLLIGRGLAGLESAQAIDRAQNTLPGSYTLQASIAACHARAAKAADTDWARIAALYGVLGRIAPSPVIELNRAMAIAMHAGAEAGLRIVDALRDEPALNQYPLLPAVRADLLAKLGRHEEAQGEFERAASLTRNARERTALLKRAVESGAKAPMT